jgi:microsomal dipeptidase-like Zn-dependent dipeptidase
MLIDFHCHPTLKHFLFGHSPLDKGHATADLNYTNIVVTEEAMKEGGVQAVLAAHYLPEKPIPSDWASLDAIKPLKKYLQKHSDKIEGEDAFAQTIGMIDAFEALFQDSETALIAHSYAELQVGLEAGRRVFVHTLEGAHHLGREASLATYLDRIRLLKEKGVAMLTLCHFYPNAVTTPTEGLPPGQKHLVGMRYVPQEQALTPEGHEIVTALLENGILVDLTHTNQQARREIYELNRKKGNRPLVFSHSGVRALFRDREHPHFSLIAPDDDELLEIRACNGLIGVVFMNYFLCGREEKPLRDDDAGEKHLLATIRHIASVTGSFDHIAIGTDFDGMSDPPDDFYSYRQDISALLMRSRDYLGATEADIEKILKANVLRVLQNGWTG